MKPAAMHHVGLVVEDIDTAGRFYEEVFGAKWRVEAATIGPPGAAAVFDGPDGLSVEVGMLELTGTLLELFAFNGDSTPEWLDTRRVLVPHLALQVDDVEACLARLEQAGGSRVWSEPILIGGSPAIFVRDPDGNTFELLEASAEELVDALLATSPGEPEEES